jgi:hypothetical protein
MESVRPGLNIELVTEMDCTRETINVKTSTVYETSGNTVVVAQTDPPVGPSLIGHVITVTYVRRKEGKLERHGFSARLSGITDYALKAGTMVKALQLESEGGAEPCSIRMFHRVEPSRNNRVRLFIEGREVKVLDVSLGGMRFAYGRTVRVDPGKTEDICVDIGKKTYKLKARICRTWEKTDIDCWREDGVASVEFVNASGTFERELVRTLHQMEREARAEDSSPE